MVMKASPTPSFILAQAKFAFHFLVITVNPPTDFR